MMCFEENIQLLGNWYTSTAQLLSVQVELCEDTAGDESLAQCRDMDLEDYFKRMFLVSFSNSVVFDADKFGNDNTNEKFQKQA
jgi:hypothetical protein